ncbi:hypothetical protein HZA96_02230 [Candidatus Woesearchaeota archaeon]|nr:hypothetical protein [Candidatus Woesearchaeota archaeon]
MIKSLDLSRTSLTTFIQEMESSLRTLNDAVLQQSLDESKRAAEEKLRELVGSLELKLASYEQTVMDSLQKRRTDLEKDYALKLHQLEERRVILEESYSSKMRELTDKLECHREKIRKDAFKIAPGLAEIFPDRIKEPYNYYSDGKEFKNYEERVDSYLRKFYELQMLKDLGTCEYVEVAQTLDILKVLKETCVHRRNRASGAEVRYVYSGLRAVLYYVSTHEITMDAALDRIKITSSQLNSKSKLLVEELLENSFPYDFNMDQHLDGLHVLNAKTKEQLGLK